jgi:acyl-CoA reductase-like NAD-dependent aldehyde dehydrogenase
VVENPATGEPLAEVANAGPETVDRVRGAAGEGAELVTGDPALDGPGHFLRPAVVAGVAPGTAIYRDELFGTVVTVTPFDGDDEAIALANDTRNGLAAYTEPKSIFVAL